MAIFTGHFRMGTQQFEICFVMVILDKVPIFRGMAGGAIGTQLALVRIIILVTGKAILRCSLQIHYTASAHMTLRTEGQCVPPNQRKCEFVMSKIVPECIFSIMAVQAGLAESDHMVDHES